MPFLVHIVCIISCSFRFNYVCLLFTILPVAGTCGEFKMASKMATNNKNGPLNINNISNFHSVYNTLYLYTFMFIRISMPTEKEFKYVTISI